MYLKPPQASCYDMLQGIRGSYHVNRSLCSTYQSISIAIPCQPIASQLCNLTLYILLISVTIRDIIFHPQGYMLSNYSEESTFSGYTSLPDQ